MPAAVVVGMSYLAASTVPRTIATAGRSTQSIGPIRQNENWHREAKHTLPLYPTGSSGEVFVESSRDLLCQEPTECEPDFGAPVSMGLAFLSCLQNEWPLRVKTCFGSSSRASEYSTMVRAIHGLRPSLPNEQ